MKNLLPLALLAITVLAVTGCFRDSDATAGAADSASAPAPAAAACGPIKIAVLLDKSASAPKARTAAVELGDIESAIDAIAACGGELSVGTIHNRRMEPFVRLRLAPPPTEPVAPAESSNRLTRRRQRAEFQPILAAYQHDFDAWQSEAQEAVDSFTASLDGLLASPADAMRSPIWNAVRRADVLLGEADPEWPASRRWMVAVTDGIDDTNGRAVELESGATVLVVNGLGSGHSLDVLKPRLFESLASALRMISRDAGVEED